MNLKELQIRNFLSYGNKITKIPLDFVTPTLVIGENHDTVVNGEFCTNGSGKTTILNALSYALYGKAISTDIKVNELINNINKKNLYISVIFEINGIYYKIERWRKNKKMGGVSNNGVKISSGKSLDDIENIKTPAIRSIDEYISEQILRLPFEIFVRIVVFTPRYRPFLSMPVTHTKEPSQTSILEELFGQTELTEKAVKLKEVIKNTSIDIKSLQDLNERIINETERYKEQLKHSEVSVIEWDKTHKNNIQYLKDEISNLSKIDFDGQLELIQKRNLLQNELNEKKSFLNSIELKLSEHNKNKIEYNNWILNNEKNITQTLALLEPLKTIKFDDELIILDNIDTLIKEKNKLDSIESDKHNVEDALLKSIEKINKDLEELHNSICPYCKQTFLESKTKITECETKLNTIVDERNDNKTILEQCNIARDKIKIELNKLSSIFDNKNDLYQSRSKFETLTQKFEEIKSALNPYERLLLSESEYNSLLTYKEKILKEIDLLTTKLQEFNNMNLLAENVIYSEKSRFSELQKQLVDKLKEINPYTETIERLNKIFEAIDKPQNDKIEQLNTQLLHQNFLLKLLTKKDSFIRQALLDANLPLLNDRLHYYLNFMALPHKVSFTKEMVISITQFNNEIDFANLSGGQQARINLAIAFAFRDVVQARYQKINFCILDECLDTGLSNLGIKLAAKMIKQVAYDNDLSMYIITHRDEIKSSFEKQIKAVLKGGLTTLELN
jgi:DNA repair exonuclease SbcCD ATPase subunit